jgi:hypothetical protein
VVFSSGCFVEPSAEISAVFAGSTVLIAPSCLETCVGSSAVFSVVSLSPFSEREP